MFHADAEHLDNSSALVRLRGDLDQDSVPVLERTLRRCLAAGRTRLFVDCLELRFCDSSGLNALLRAHRAAGDLGGAVLLVRPSDGLLTRLDLTGLDQVLTVRHDLPAPLPSMQSADLRAAAVREHPSLSGLAGPSGGATGAPGRPDTTSTSSCDGVQSAFAAASALAPLDRLHRLRVLHEARQQERRLAIENARPDAALPWNGGP
ncbi:STAS domain-containing protein [Kitasatospora indigofera]|uniref:STAS domain-containing protein n=1 Tax=Kitasatospora indigofera TaxID=67307 RepID=UPI0036536571